MLGLLEQDVWYDHGGLETLACDLYVHALPGARACWSRDSVEQPLMWLVDPVAHGPINLNKTAERRWLLGVTLHALLTGPLTWLGLVEVDVRPKPTAFRVRPPVPWLLVRGTPPDAVQGDPSLSIGADGVLVVAPGDDLHFHGRVASFAELVDCSPRGLRYKLSARLAQASFNAGQSGSDLLAFLDHYANRSLPGAGQTQLKRWRSDYGSVRLYDEITLIELADDVLAAELELTCPSLRRWLLYRLSPNLLVIDAAGVEAVTSRRGDVTLPQSAAELLNSYSRQALESVARRRRDTRS